MSIPLETVQRWNMEFISQLDVSFAHQAILLHNHMVLAAMLDFQPCSE